MLHVPTDLARHAIEIRSQPSQAQWSLGALRDVIRWRRSTIFLSIVAVLVPAIIYVATASPMYTATAVLMTDTKRSPAYGADGAADTSVDMVVVESQVETLKSDKIALAVIDKLRLWEDPEFVGKGPTLWSYVMGLLRPSGTKRSATQDVKRQIAAGNFKKALQVQRAGRSYVSEISFTSLDPEKAAAIANAIAQAYIVDQLSAKLQVAQRSSDWVENRVGELRQRASDAAKAVAEYKSANGITGDNTSPNDQVAESGQQRLRELEAAEQSARTVYETFLNRYTQSVQMQQQSFPVTEARVLAEAVPPLSKSAPKTNLILLLAAVAGASLGLVAAFTREQLERLVRTPRQLERELGVRVIGFLPTVRRPLLSRGGPLHLIDDAKSALPFGRLRPLSQAGEGVRGIKVAIDRHGGGSQALVVGISSPHPGTGKTTLAYNLALLAARCGNRTLLIDGDLRRSTLTRSLAPQHEHGIVSLLAGKADPSSCIVAHADNLHFLGGLPAPDAGGHPSDALASPAMASTLDEMRHAYDYVFVDLPPLLNCVDVRASAPMIGAFILALEWGRTSLDDLDRALASCDIVVERLLGVAVNKVAVAEMARRY
jgi:polysaccharide biosynthesis transport protein